MSIPSEYADLLNRLDEMQQAPYYASARKTLAEAEGLIVHLEGRKNELAVCVAELLGCPELNYDDPYELYTAAAVDKAHNLLEGVKR